MNNTAQQSSPTPQSLREGERAPEFHLPSHDGVPVTFYERYCGQPTTIILANTMDDLAPYMELESEMVQLGIVRGVPEDTADTALNIVRDDGRLAQALAGGFPPVGQVIAMVFNHTLRLLQRHDKPRIEELTEFHKERLEWYTSTQAVTATAPVLMIPSVLDRELCGRLIAVHQADNYPSGMMRLVEGELRLVQDPQVKSRSDHLLEDPALIGQLRDALSRQILPAITGAFNYRVTRFEGFKIVAYDAGEDGHFRAHRDNMTPDAKHRRFALSINLNQEFEGGELVFPEFGPMRYRAPLGGAVVFSGSLLHEARKVQTGRRYVLLSFLWGEE